MKQEINRKTICLLLINLWFASAVSLFAQDAKPAQVHVDDFDPDEMVEAIPDSVPLDTSSVVLTHLKLPASFLHTKENKLLYAEGLYTFFAKVNQRAARSVRVVQIGDSHIRGHVLPVAVRRCLEEAWGNEAVYPDQINYQTTALARETGKPGFVFHAIGRNGATLNYYLDEARQRDIANLHPDLIIISLGTNESHGIFESAAYTMLLDRFTARMRELCPGVTFLLTTPPGSHITNYRTVRRKRRGRYYSKRVVAGRIPNHVAGRVAACQRNYGQSRGLAVWDLYETVGGDMRACANWKSAGMMAGDGVHYNHTAYNIQGDLLGEALLKAYNEYQQQR